ncbi:MAG: GNAT family N-acetyltransferase [Actinobacteria bacterium]|nr:GNAT family N-acetyltransferase [Actinomycetota bacterium]
MIWWPTEVPTLQHGLITLRPAQEKDILSIYQACQDPTIPKFTTVPSPYSMAHAISFIREQAPTHFAEKSELLFVITEGYSDNEEFCGLISFHTINLQNHTTELGYWIAKPARGRGIGTTAAKSMVEYGFSTMGFRRIEALVDVDNLASKALLLSASFELEGIMRKKVTRENGSQIDMALFSRVAPW